MIRKLGIKFVDKRQTTVKRLQKLAFEVQPFVSAMAIHFFLPYRVSFMLFSALIATSVLASFP